MSVGIKSARGASAFTRTDTSLSLSNVDRNGFHPEVVPEHAWNSLIDELLRIRMLEDDWDGEGTEAPHPSLVDGAISLALTLQSHGISPADRVIAGVNGTVYFEWHTSLWYQEIEVTSPLEAESRRLAKGSERPEIFGIHLHP